MAGFLTLIIMVSWLALWFASNMVLPTAQCREAIMTAAVKTAVNGISACAPVDSGVSVTLSACASEQTIWLAFINQIKVAFCYLLGISTDVVSLQNDVTTLQTDVDAAEADIVALQTDVTTLEGQQSLYLTKAANLSDVANKFSSLANLGAMSVQSMVDASYIATDPVAGGNLLIVTTVAFTGARQVVLPYTGAMQPGAIVTVADELGTVTGGNTLTVIASLGDGDVINQGVGTFVISSAFGSLRFATTGNPSWTSI